MQPTSPSLDALEARHIRWCAWSAVVFLVLFGVGWGICGRNLPPYPGAMPAEEIAGIYRDHAATMRFGFALAAFACTFLLTWSIGIYRLMLQIDPRAQVIAQFQLFGGALTCLVPMFACIIWLTAAYRPEQDPETIRMLADMGWLMIDLAFGVTTLQYVAVGYVILHDRRPRPVLPRWVAWLGIWIGLEFLLEIMMPQFRSGPFSWEGLFNFWLPFFAPFTWMTILTIGMLKAATRLSTEPDTLPDVSAVAADSAL